MNKERRQLLDKYLSGTCNRQELEQIKQLLEEPATEEILHELMMERAAQYDTAIPDNKLMDKVKDWEEQVLKRIETSGEDKASGRRGVIRLLRYAAVWAGILLLSAFAVWQYRNAISPEQVTYAFVEHMNREAFPVRYLLPDSSEVYLGGGGKLRYPEHFSRTSREVSLWGEAFFEVKPDRERPFLVQTRSMQTQVLGTSFKIEAFEDYPLVVAVATGKVGVSTNANGTSKNLAMLTPGLKLTYDEVTGIHQKGTTDVAGLQQWTTGDLVFDELPLRLVMLELEKRYDITVTFSDPETANYRVSGSFDRKQDLQSVLTMLSIIGKFKYKLDHNHSVNISKQSPS